jgi:putative SOS response-associated peptidase YedK
VTVDLFVALTTAPIKLVGTYHPKAMPVICNIRQEIDLWVTVPIKEAPIFAPLLADDTAIPVELSVNAIREVGDVALRPHLWAPER